MWWRRRFQCKPIIFFSSRLVFVCVCVWMLWWLSDKIDCMCNVCVCVESCCGDDQDYKLVPLKKRKGIFERNPNEETSKMKSKTNKKCGENLTFDRKPVTGEDGNIAAKKSKRGSVIMEGSRCSRVNGRGWRCCQPTLVGYSLCEHHLGKGRLRSMASVRWQQQQSNEGDPQPLFVATKKRSKVGVVKARSMSSLLSQS